MKIIDNIKKNTILLVIITIIVLYFVLKDDAPGIWENLKHIKDELNPYSDEFEYKGEEYTLTS